ncbi:MAG: hypothetical protein WAS24_05175 [Thermoplasmata archaeon]
MTRPRPFHGHPRNAFINKDRRAPMRTPFPNFDSTEDGLAASLLAVNGRSLFVVIAPQHR